MSGEKKYTTRNGYRQIWRPITYRELPARKVDDKDMPRAWVIEHYGVYFSVTEDELRELHQLCGDILQDLTTGERQK